MKTKEIKVYNLPEDRVINESIDAKPYLLIVIVIIFGLFLMGEDFASGLTVAIFGAAVLLLMPRSTLIEFYDDYLILYNKANHNFCTMVYYEDVASWHYSYGITVDELLIELEDGNVLSVEGFNKMLFESNMNRYLKNKKQKTR